MSDVLNVGGFIQNADVQRRLQTAIQSVTIISRMGKNFNDKKRSVLELETTAVEIRKSIISMLEEAGSGHSAGPLGLADIFTALYFSILKIDPEEPDWDGRDLFLLSNGHCVPVQYATMAEAGYFHKTELKTLRKFGTRLQGHPERQKLPGLETTRTSGLVSARQSVWR